MIRAISYAPPLFITLLMLINPTHQSSRPLSHQVPEYSILSSLYVSSQSLKFCMTKEALILAGAARMNISCPATLISVRDVGHFERRCCNRLSQETTVRTA